ncbi:MAG: zinc-binding alcohol dehydrogenase [Candidatus Hydrogenedentes bacterium]|nr:zinc-binding alcohol dehydrogenase [Candidatus Hydrogenedentota bacterium]
MKARAVYFPDRLRVEFGDVTVPEPGPSDVVVQTKYSFISNGTEGSFLRGERINGETAYRPGDVWPFPIAPGYQSTGIVESVGSAVTDIHPGQWVFAALGRVEGMYEPWGGHISPKVTDRSQIWAVPESVSPVAVSGLVLAQVGYNSGTRPEVKAGDTALIIGDGLVGHWTAQTLHQRGANVILAGRHADRLALFRDSPGRRCVNAATEDLAAAVRRLAPEGVHILVDTVGSIATIRELFPLLTHNSHIVSTGFHGADCLMDIQLLRFKECTLHSPSGWEKRRMDETLDWIAAGHLEVESLITHRFPVEKAAEAWELILDKSEPSLGVLLTWD